MTTNPSIPGAPLPVAEPDIPGKAVKLALRIMQVANEKGPGKHHFALIIQPDGRWQLEPPPKVEELGL